MQTVRSYGCRRGPVCERTRKFEDSRTVTRAVIPPTYDMRSWTTPKLIEPPYDQLQLNSCVGNAIGRAWQVALRRIQKPAPMPARLFVYYQARVIENSTESDSGAVIGDGLTALSLTGCCAETLWPYKPAKVLVKPSAPAYAAAQQHTALKYYSVAQDIDHIKFVVASNLPVIFGFDVFNSFESGEVEATGVVPMPQPGERILNTHAVCIIGYDDTTRRFTCANSWGTTWGAKGFFTIPYEYVLNTAWAFDFFVVEVVN